MSVPVEPVEERADPETCYWIGEFCRHGMTLSQAEVLADNGCDRHAVRDTLEHGCDPDTAFLIYS